MQTFRAMRNHGQRSSAAKKIREENAASTERKWVDQIIRRGQKVHLAK
jgi:hypothetical protein